MVISKLLFRIKFLTNEGYIEQLPSSVLQNVFHMTDFKSIINGIYGGWREVENLPDSANIYILC